jgi:hypothetical protein
LADSTVAQKSLGPFSDISILRETNDLYFSLTRVGDVNAVLYQESPTVLVMGTSIPYAGYHMRRYRNRPARPPIRRVMRTEDKLKMEKTIKRQALKFARDVGFTQTSTSDFE